MTKLRKILIASVFFVFFAACASLTLSEVLGPKTKPDITVVSEIKVSSKRETRPYLNDFESVVTGTIINNTNKDLENVQIIVKVETVISETPGSLVINIDKLEAQHNFYINHTFSTQHDFEDVEEVQFAINNSVPKEIENPEEPASFTEIIIYIIMGVIFLSAGITTLTTKTIEKQYNSDDDDDYDDDDDDIETLDDILQDEEIERLKGEVEKQKAENEQLKKEANSLKVCPYCNTKSPSNSLKCPNCGAHFK